MPPVVAVRVRLPGGEQCLAFLFGITEMAQQLFRIRMLEIVARIFFLGLKKDIPVNDLAVILKAIDGHATEIKIDKAFVSNAPIDPKDRHIVKAATELAHAFGMRVVGEGVDDAASMKTLEEVGCELAQGFYIARPMRADLLLEWARAYESTTTVRTLTKYDSDEAVGA